MTAPKAEPYSDHWDKGDILGQLDESRVRAFYEFIGVDLNNGGPDDWLVHSPFRRDRNPSVTIRKADGVWSDKATGDGGSIFDAAMRHMECSFQESLSVVADGCGLVPRKIRVPASEVPTHYVYSDADGVPRFEVVRKDKGDGVKTFTQWHMDPDTGAWASGVGDAPRIPYNLHDISHSSTPIYFVEGEKCADALAEQELTATCIMGGSNGWRNDYIPHFVGRDVVILPDNDEPGYKFATTVADALLSETNSLKVVDLPLGPRLSKNGLDVVDYLGQGHSISEVMGYVDSAPLYVPDGAIPDVTEGIADLLSEDIEPPDQLISGIWDPGGFGMIVANPKSWKSFLGLDMLCSIATGTPFLGAPGFFVSEPGPVMYWMEEGSRYDLRRRILRWCEARGVDPAEITNDRFKMIFGRGLHVSNDEHLAMVRAAVERYKPVLLICDTLASVSWGMDENKTDEASRIIRGLSQMRGVNGENSCAVIYIHHSNKMGGIRGSSSFFGAVDNICLIERPDPDENVIHIKLNNRLGHLAEDFTVEMVDNDAGDGALFYQGPIGVRPKTPTIKGTGGSRDAALECIRNSETGLTAGELAKALKKDPTQVYRWLGQLVDDELIFYMTRADNKKVAMVTEKGWGNNVPF